MLNLAALLIVMAHAALVYRPTKFDPAKANLLVVLHGCQQTPEAMALGTGFDHGAEARNTLVIYPSVPANSHPDNCWGWYSPANQRAESGQLKTIMDEVQRVREQYGLKNPHVFAAGWSAGASMVAGLLACFPDQFAGGVIHSGVAYGVALDELEAKKMASDGHQTYQFDAPCNPRAFKGRLLIIHGTRDGVVAPSNVARIVAEFAPGSRSMPREVHSSNAFSFGIREFRDASGPRVRVIKVHGLTHAWSGSDQNRRPFEKFRLPFFSNWGPSATNHSWKFIDETLRGDVASFYRVSYAPEH